LKSDKNIIQICHCLSYYQIFILIYRRSQISSAKHSDEHKSVCVVTGPRGSGKTALVSNWLQNEAGQVVPSDTAIIYHYATCDRMARNIAVFMKRCIRKLRQAFMVNYGESHNSCNSSELFLLFYYCEVY